MSKVCKESEGIRWGIWGKLMDLDCADDMSVNPLYMNNAEDAQKIRKRIRQSHEQQRAPLHTQ